MPHSPLRPLGSVLKVDQDGFLVPDAAINKIAPHWRAPVDVIVKSYETHLGASLRSVYLRGSVAKGEAIDGVSDIDTFALVKIEVDNWLPPWRKEIQKEISTLFPFVSGTEIILISPTRLSEVKRLRNAWQRLIKTQSVCLWGEDISDWIPPFRPGPEMLGHIFSILDELAAFDEGWDAHPSERALRCTWIMKRVLRTGLELVMERAQVYTRDLYPCFEIFSKHYPQHESSMRQVLELAINPTEDKHKLQPPLEVIGSLFEQEIPKVLARVSV